jgi:hypothetical protein
MPGFNRNVYDTFDRIHQLSGHADHPDDASAMDRAEYQIQVNKLVEGLVEILQHAATHRLISLDIGDFDHELEPGEIGVYRDDSDEPAANHTVAIRVPDEYLPEDEGALSEAVAAFDLPTVETSADLAVATMARLRLLTNEDRELETSLYERWSEVATSLLPRVVPALRRLESAGLITVYDARTKRSYVPIGVGTDRHEASAEIAFVSQEDRAKPSAAAKKTARKAPSPRAQKKK